MYLTLPNSELNVLNAASIKSHILQRALQRLCLYLSKLLDCADNNYAAADQFVNDTYSQSLYKLGMFLVTNF